MRDLAEELDAAEEDVKFSLSVLRTAEARLKIDQARLEAIQALIASEAEARAIRGEE